MTVLIRPITLIVLFLSCWNSHAQEQHSNRPADWMFGGFVRPQGINPIIEPDSTTSFADPMSGQLVRWEENDTFNPAAAVKGDSLFVLYRAEDKTGIKIGHRTSRIGYAASADGLSFNRQTKPVFYPGKDSQQAYEWPGGTEDPRIAVTADGQFVMFYTLWNRDVPRLGVAISNDLKTWIKQGPIFAKSKNDPSLVDRPHKSASIVTELIGEKQVIAKVNGKYWMYWGERGVYGATSDNLIDWEPVLDEKGKLKAFISPRDGYFDSSLTECGPPAIKTEKGILLLYNGRNDHNKGDERFTKGTYSAGQVLFDLNDPTKAIGRSDVPFFRPMESFEKSGQYRDGTVFIEGLVYFQKKWFLYYGCADSKVGVAIYDPEKPADFDPIP